MQLIQPELVTLQFSWKLYFAVNFSISDTTIYVCMYVFIYFHAIFM